MSFGSNAVCSLCGFLLILRKAKTEPLALRIRRILLLVLALCPVLCASCRQRLESGEEEPEEVFWVTTPQDSTLAVGIMQRLDSINRTSGGLSTGQLMAEAGSMLLGKKYVGGTLDEGDKEALRIYLQRTDCVIFVETIFNLAQEVREHAGMPTFAGFARHMLSTRYRAGRCERYSDRIHYGTQWIRKQEALGLVRDITMDLGGEEYDHPISYMSDNFFLYPHLALAPKDSVAAEDLRIISEVEDSLNTLPHSRIPQGRVRDIQGKIQTGDIIWFTSPRKGLDIAHVAIAYVRYPDGTVIYGPHTMDPDPERGGTPIVGYMHASSVVMRVIVDKMPIWKSVQDYYSFDGIKVTRPL